MARIISIKGITVLEYLDKYPKMPAHQLSRLIYKENSELWNNHDSVRSLVRAYKGQHGSKSRKELTNTKYYTEPKFENMFNKFDVKTEYIPVDPYIVPTGYKKTLLMGDIHIPFHDEGALNTAMEHGYKEGVDSIILMGDISDFYDLSRFSKKPDRVKTFEEVDMLKAFLEYLRKQFPTQKIFYKFGNHERRWESFMWNKAQELYGLKEIELPYILHLEALDIALIEEKRIIKYGKLNLLHGHELGGGGVGGINAARNLYLRTQTNAACFHWHRRSEFSKVDLNDSQRSCWTVGCLSGLKPDYMPHNDWVHGFAIVEKEGDGAFEFHNKKIIKNKVR